MGYTNLHRSDLSGNRSGPLLKQGKNTLSTLGCYPRSQRYTRCPSPWRPKATVPGPQVKWKYRQQTTVVLNNHAMLRLGKGVRYGVDQTTKVRIPGITAGVNQLVPTHCHFWRIAIPSHTRNPCGRCTIQLCS